MNIKKLTNLAIVTVGVAFTTLGINKAANATTITFDALPRDIYFSGTYVESGFNLNVDNLFGGPDPVAGIELEPTCCTSAGSLTVSKVGGGLFGFTSIDIRTEYDYGGSTTLTVQGFLNGILQKAQTFTSVSFDYSTISALEWTGLALDKLLITGDRSFSGIAFNNLTVGDASVPTSVPEPTSALGLLAFTSLGAGFVLKRKKLQKVTVKA